MVEAYETTGGTLAGSTITSATGYFAVGVPGDTYDVVVEMDLYLDSVYSGVAVAVGSLTTLPDLTLPGGDRDGNDTINIVDISGIATDFGTTAPGSDINADGTVNIVDLAGAASNFGQSSPVPWP